MNMPIKSPKSNHATITWKHSDTSDTVSTLTLHLLLLMLSSAPVSTIAILFSMAHLNMSHTNSNEFKTLSPELFSSPTV